MWRHMVQGGGTWERYATGWLVSAKANIVNLVCYIPVSQYHGRGRPKMTKNEFFFNFLITYSCPIDPKMYPKSDKDGSFWVAQIG